VEVTAPDVPGSHDLVLRLRSGGRPVAENRYPVHVVDEDRRPIPVRLLGLGGLSGEALAAVGAAVGDEGLAVVGEDRLGDAAAEVRSRLEDGEVVVVLAQGTEAAAHYPLPVELEALTTVWGSTVFRFTTDHGAIPSLPRRAVVVAEDSTIQASSVVASIGGRPFPDTPVVIAYKPVPGAMTGTVLGSHPVGEGRMVFCQYRLAARATAGDPSACAILADLLRWGALPRPVMSKQATVKDDGRNLVVYSWHDAVAR
jgi:hypothetical protein